MAVTAERVTAGAAAVALNPENSAAVHLLLSNTSANDADLGPSGVSGGAGYLLAAGDTVTVEVDAGDQLFAIQSGASAATITVLRT